MWERAVLRLREKLFGEAPLRSESQIRVFLSDESDAGIGSRTPGESSISVPSKKAIDAAFPCSEGKER